MESLCISKGNTELKLLNNNLKYEVIKNGFSWVGQGRIPHIVFQKKILGKYLWFPKPFSWAKVKKHIVTEDSIISIYSGFRLWGKKLALRLEVTARIIEDGKVDFSIEAFEEEGMEIKAVYFPQPFNAKIYDSKTSYTVDPRRQGFMLPDIHRVNRREIFLITKYWRTLNTGEAYMPVWGRVCGRQGYAGMAEDGHDMSLFSCYGRKKAFLTSSNWYGSLGKLDYKRTVHYHFYDECDYVTFAKEYRHQLIRQREFRTIDEKITANPNVANLIGSPIIHWRIMENTVPESIRYVKGGENTRLHHTFYETAEKFSHFKANGLDKAYVHLDGWGKRGYDNLHPYILPPGSEAGGWKGLKALSDRCHELGYQFGLHDQYRDYYQDCELYDDYECVTDINGKKSFCDEWDGGAHNWLCSSLAKPYVERTYKELNDHGVRINGTYLDVFSIMSGDECYHPEHKVTRRESIAYRRDCFDMLRGQGLIVSSEEPGHQMINSIDLVHHAPYSITPQEKGVGVGIAIPFSNLVYHECVFVPWLIDGIGGWGIPDGDAGKLHCILNGQSPYFSDSMSVSGQNELGAQLLERINEAKEVAAINAKVYNAEMLSHEFLDSKYRVQQTKFSNGYVITVDFDTGRYTVEKNNQQHD